MRRWQRSTPSGQHRPVLLSELIDCLQPQAGSVVADVTVGCGGHAAELLTRILPGGRLIGLDLDADNLARARACLQGSEQAFALHHANYAGLPAVLAKEGLTTVDAIVGDLGMSSTQVDDVERGFSYVRDGPLDMRMDRSRGATAASLLATISEDDLARTLRELGDEPHAAEIAAAIARARRHRPLERTTDLSKLVMETVTPGHSGRWRLHPRRHQWVTHPAARTFQVLRILVNRELENLRQLLRVLPTCLRPGGRVALISFHSGEDRLIKIAFRDGLRSGIYSDAARDPLRASLAEKNANPRARSAKLRWAVRA